VTALWPAALPALAALAGVLLGQFIQGRREEKRWHRERERDEALWSQQRDKDAALWAREDRIRFADYRRDLYADFLATLIRYADLLERASVEIDIEEHRRVDEGETLLDNYGAWLYERGYDDLAPTGKDLDLLTQRVGLVAPAPVERTAASLNYVARSAIEMLIINKKPTLAYDVTQDVFNGIPELHTLMRADLTGHGEPT